MKRNRLIHINNGLGAGNIGDEIMAQAFWAALPEAITLEVPLWPEARRFRGAYPPPHRYFYLDNPTPGDPLACYPRTPDAPGLLVGDTPVSEFEGLAFPLGMVGPTLGHFALHGYSVDAVAVGVDRLVTPEGRGLFAEHYTRIRSWTVRTAACREALLDLGIPADRIRVAADLAWLHEPSPAPAAWAAELWAKLGVRPAEPLLCVNLTHHTDPGEAATKQRVAAALDLLASRHGFQIAFVSNETRPDDHFDDALARRIQGLMRERSVVVPPDYYSPDEMIALLGHATALLSQRYHMAIESILAGTVPACVLRGQKVTGLAAELALPSVSLTPTTDPAEIAAAVLSTLEERELRLTTLAAHRGHLRERAGEALSFVREALADGDYARQTARLRPRAPRSPRSILVSHLGGLGDLVLASSLVASLRRAHPEARIRLLVPARFAPLIAGYPDAPDEVIGLPFDPAQHLRPSPELNDHLEQLAAALGPEPPDLYLAADLEPSWLAWYLAARLKPAQAVNATRLESPRGILPILFNQQQLTPVAFRAPAGGPAAAHELERFTALLAQCGAPPAEPPRWTAAVDPVRPWLAANRLEPGRYLVCFPTGAGSSPAKRWPLENYRAALTAFALPRGLAVVLNGDPRDRQELTRFADELTALGLPAAVFTGADFEALAALLAGAALFFGNDTGPAHLAQALGRPGVIVFGGGCWPNYAPWAPGAHAVTHPLPCFGCSWDCAFGRGLCVESIPVPPVTAALDAALDAPGAAPQSTALATLTPREEAAIAGAARQYRAAQTDRHARFQALVETEYSIAAERQRNESMRRDSANLREEASRRTRGMLELAQLLATRDERIRALESAARPAEPLQGPAELVERIHQLEETIAQQNRALEHTGQLLGESSVAPPPAELLTQLQTIAAGADAEAHQLLDRVAREFIAIQAEAERRQQALAAAEESIQRLLGRNAQNEEALAQRLTALEEVNALLAAEQRRNEELRAEIARLAGEVELHRQRAAEQADASAQRLTALEEVNTLLATGHSATRQLQEEVSTLHSEILLRAHRLAELEVAAAERLRALEEANLLLASQQEENARLRAEVAQLTSEVTLQSRRIAELEPAAIARLRSLEEANALLASSQQEVTLLRTESGALHALLEHRTRNLAMFETAAAERLAALENADRLLRREHQLRAALLADLSLLRQSAAEAAHHQQAERQRLAQSIEELRGQLARLSAEHAEAAARAAHAESRLAEIAPERDRFYHALHELQHSEVLLLQEVVALREESLLQSLFRRLGTSR